MVYLSVYKDNRLLLFKKKQNKKQILILHTEQYVSQQLANLVTASY